uniref:Uncharacterized protein n=1 Tax=Strombidium inclinatum TaxID=197538 RepID=A0A7S3IET5_9SPIT
MGVIIQHVDYLIEVVAMRVSVLRHDHLTNISVVPENFNNLFLLLCDRLRFIIENFIAFRFSSSPSCFVFKAEGPQDDRLLLGFAIYLEVSIMGRALAVIGVGRRALRVLGSIHVGAAAEGRAVALGVLLVFVDHLRGHFNLGLVRLALLGLNRVGGCCRIQVTSGGLAVSKIV